MRGFALLAAAALFSTAALGQATGDVTGRVADSDGNPIVGAQVSLQPGSRRVLSDEAGRFEFRSVAAGRVTIVVQRIGYQPRTLQVDVTTSGVAPTVVLTAIPRTLDSVRVLERAAPNRFSATVVDDGGAPLADVAVTIEGVSNTIRTDSAGHFVAPKQLHGTIMIRMRKIGYAAYLGSLRMLATRDDTLRMFRLAQGMTPVQINAASGFGRDSFAYKELDQRARWKGEQSAVISREELDQAGRVDLCTAFPFTPTGSRYNAVRGCGGGCVILNGEGRTLMPPRAYYADQVEMVEFYPPGSDHSGSLAARGCSRGFVFVIWLKKDSIPKPLP